MKSFSITSDLHGCLDIKILPCDFLLISGDICPLGIDRNTELSFKWFSATFLPWLDKQPAKYKIFIAGNHDFMFQEVTNAVLPKDCYYLFDSAIEIEGIKFWGSPWTPWFWNWAFNFPQFDLDGSYAQSKWNEIPEDTDVLLTHGPPANILDHNYQGTGCGCPDLKIRIPDLNQLKLHCFGHIHEGFGQKEYNGVTYINSSYGYKGQENYETAPYWELNNA